MFYIYFRFEKKKEKKSVFILKKCIKKNTNFCNFAIERKSFDFCHDISIRQHHFYKDNQKQTALLRLVLINININ